MSLSSPRWRSLLFVPGDNLKHLEKVHERGADAVIIDFEDAVAPEAKPRAREIFRDVAPVLAAQGVDVLVRLNAEWRLAFADLDAVVSSDLRALVVPKVEGPERLLALGELIGEFEAERGLRPGAIGLVALIESPASLARLAAIAAVPRVIGLALGSEDFSLGLGVAPTSASLDLPCRLIALAAASQSLMALGLPISIGEFRRLDAYREAALAARAAGLTGALCIHPAQVAVINEVFAPGAAERARAQRIVEAWDASGGKAVLQIDGAMVDLPVVLRARRILAC
ncbi:MAG: CoA ester lyase [Parvibaculaceae bacterium]|nr:CoA ester lyase [Parvibaculaceae bacterium]